MSHLHQRASALIDGELRGRALARAVAHLRSCEGCRQEVEQILMLKRRLLGIATAEPPAALLASLAQLRPPADPDRRPRLVETGRRLLVGAGSVSMAVLFVAYAVGGAEPAEAPRVSPALEELTAEYAVANRTAPLSDPSVVVLGSRRLTSERWAQTAPVGRASRHLHASGYPLEARKGEPSPVGGGPDEGEAVVQLQRAMQAPASVAYSGVHEVAVVAGGSPTVARIHIEHAPGQGTSLRAHGADGTADATFLGQNGPAPNAPLPLDGLAVLVDTYTLTTSGAGVVAGRPATVVSATRSGSLAARFWIDKASGLLLRREVFDGGRVVSSSSFLSVTIRADGFLSHLPPEVGAATATPVSMQLAPTLNDEGWSCPEVLAGGFRLTLLQRLEGDGQVVHAAYSDGLSTLSVFEERGRLDPDAIDGFTEGHLGGGVVAQRQGMPMITVWESGGTVYTVVTDAPPRAAERAVAALPHEPAAGGEQPSRLVRGLHRIASLAGLGG